MKLIRPILIGSLALAGAALALALGYSIATDNFQPDALQLFATTPTRAALAPTRPNVPNDPVSLPTASPEPTSTPDIPAPTIPLVPAAALQQGLTLRRNGDYTRAAQSFRAALTQNPEARLAREARFRLGECLWLAGDYPNATAALNAVLAENAGDNFAARAHYFLADLFIQTRAYAQALEHLRAYRAQSRALGGTIDAEIAQVMLAAGDNVGAINQYRAALADQTLPAKPRVEIYKQIADIHLKLGEAGLAAARLSEALNFAPDDAARADLEYRWGLALDAAKEHPLAVAHWQNALNAYPTTAGAYQALVQLVNAGEPKINEFTRGLANYYHGTYDAAVQAFARYLQAHSDHDAEAHYYTALAYQKKGAPSPAVKAFDEIIKTHPKDPRVKDAWYGKAGAQAQAGDLTGAVASYRQFAALYPQDWRADDALWHAATLFETNGRANDAALQYEQVAAKYPAGSYAPGALFNAGWAYYIAQNYTNAAARWNSAVKNYPASTQADRAQYWLGKLARTRGDPNAARQWFEQASQTPRTYYSWRALDALKPAPKPVYAVAAYAMSAQPNERAEFDKWLAGWSAGGAVSDELNVKVLSDPNFQRGVELAELDRAAEARLEFAQANEHLKGDARALYALARYYQASNYFSMSIDAAQRLRKLSPAPADDQAPRYLRELIYPTYYADLVVPYAQKHGFDPALFFALMRQESGFNPLSYSSAAARGLTQVIPGTALGIARELGVKNFAQEDLFKPYVSVRFGAYYLNAMLAQFDENVFYALMGYNAGPGNAKKWQRADVDVAVEVIHLPETYLYVRTVYAQYQEYLDIYRGR